MSPYWSVGLSSNSMALTLESYLRVAGRERGGGGRGEGGGKGSIQTQLKVSTTR